MKKQMCALVLSVLSAASVPGTASAELYLNGNRNAADTNLDVKIYPPATVAQERKPATPTPTPNAGLSQMEQEDQDAVKKFRNQPKLDLPFLISQDSWSEAMENEFGAFVHRLGQAVHDKKCGTVTSCMRNPEYNRYAKWDQPGMVLYSDCADFPYFLRAYFAWHNQLPFAYVNGLALAKQPYASEANKDDSLAKADLETSPYGNILQSRGGSNVPAPGKEGMNFITYLQRMFDTVSTRTFRSGALTPGHNLSDLYPVTLDKKGIRPGTVVSANGHVMIVWNVEKDGSVRIISGHPGAFVQEHLLDASKLQRSRPDHGFGFLRFRPLTLVNPQEGAYGLAGGKLVSASDEELYQAGLLSLDQWFGPGSNVPPGAQVSPTAWKKAFKSVGFWDYLASQLRDENSVVTADEAVTTGLGELCHSLQERAKSYDKNLAAGMPFTAHPDALPANIFGAKDAVWELRSSPGGDGRIKDAVRNLVRTSIAQYRIAKNGSRNVTFNGDARAFAQLLRQKVADANASCTVTYTNSNQQRVNLSLGQILKRLNKLSFDPYMCPEKSWGASGTEMASCRDSDNEGWYEAEVNIRNTIGKLDEDSNYVVRSDRDITIDMLRDSSLTDRPSDAKISLGTKTPPKYMDLDAIFASEDFIKALDGKDEHVTTTDQGPIVIGQQSTDTSGGATVGGQTDTSGAKKYGIVLSSRNMIDSKTGRPMPRGYSVERGEQVEIIQIGKSFTYVRTQDGKLGWVAKEAISPINAGAVSTTPRYAVVYNETWVRETAGGANAGFMTMQGERVEILTKLQGWIRVRFNGGEVGWIPTNSVR